MNVLEFDYKSFPYVSLRQPPNTDVISEYLTNSKNEILNNFSNVVKVEEVFKFGVTHLQFYDISIIKNSQGKERIVLFAKDKAQPALVLFEMIVNLAGSSKEEIDYVKEYYFDLNPEENMYYFYKFIKTISGDKVAQVIFDTWKSLNNQDVKPSFQKLAEYASQGLVVCIESTDIADRTHYKTLLNNKVAVNKQTEEEVKKLIVSLEGYFQ